MICVAVDCDRKAISKHCCDKHYRRLLKWGDPNYNPRPMVYGNEVERFHLKYQIEENGCWIWIGGTRPNRVGNLYGRHSRNDGSSISAHRFSWEVHNGPTHEGLLVCHHCDVTLCVNPKHLFLGTYQDNSDDMVWKGRFCKDRGEDKKGRAKLTNDQAFWIKHDSRSLSVLAKIYNVSPTTIFRIKSGESY